MTRIKSNLLYPKGRAAKARPFFVFVLGSGCYLDLASLHETRTPPRGGSPPRHATVPCPSRLRAVDMFTLADQGGRARMTLRLLFGGRRPARRGHAADSAPYEAARASPFSLSSSIPTIGLKHGRERAAEESWNSRPDHEALSRARSLDDARMLGLLTLSSSRSDRRRWRPRSP